MPSYLHNSRSPLELPAVCVETSAHRGSQFGSAARLESAQTHPVQVLPPNTVVTIDQERIDGYQVASVYDKDGQAWAPHATLISGLLSRGVLVQLPA